MGQQDLIDDVKIALQFLTRLPVRTGSVGGMARLARAAWAFPLVGLVVGASGALAYWLACSAGLPPSVAAILAVGSMILLTGALHEDGLADTFDALGGHAGPERALAIMRDSRIGTYGSLALAIVLALRATCLASIAAPGPVAIALIAAACVSRALMAVAMACQLPARSDGLGAGAGPVDALRAVAACLLASLTLLPARSALLALAVAAVAAGTSILVRRWTGHRLGGLTGDTLGATQQLGEVGCLIVFTAYRS